MKRFYQSLAGLLLLALFALPAEAAWNIRQKGSGGAVWTDGAVEVPVGSNGIVVPISTFAASTTYFVPIHKSGNVVKMYFVNHAAFSGAVANPTIRLGVGHGSVVFYTPISISASSATFTVATNGMTFPGVVTSAVYPVTAQKISQGQVLGIAVIAPSHLGGTGVAGVPGTITIVIE